MNQDNAQQASTRIIDQKIFNHLTNHPELVDAIIRLRPDDLTRYQEMLNWDSPLVSILIKHPILLRIMIKMTAEERSNLAYFIKYHYKLLTRFDKIPQLLEMFGKIWNKWLAELDEDALSDFIWRYQEALNHPNSLLVNMHDAFTRGQFASKTWLLDELSKLRLDLGDTWLVCGWIGVLGYMIKKSNHGFRFSKIRSFDIDPRCAAMAETFNRPEVIDSWKFKATTADAYELIYDNYFYLTKKADGTEERLVESADTIINTSCEHLDRYDEWYGNIPTGKFVVLQCSDHPDYEGHVNQMSTLNELVDRSPMKELLFMGSLDCELYNRHMVIGIK